MAAARPDPLRLVFFVKRFWPDVGGVEKYVLELARALCDKGHAVRVVAGDPTGKRTSATFDGIKVRPFPSMRSPCRAWLALQSFRKDFRWADVVHVSDVEMLEYYYRMVAWTIGPRPVCLTRHGMGAVFPAPAEERLRARRARKLSDAILDDGTFVQRRTRVPPDLVPDPGLRPAADQISPESPDANGGAVFVGRLEEDAGVEIYLDAVAILKRRGIDLPLEICGAGSRCAALQKKACDLGLSPIWRGPVANAQERLSRARFAFVSGRMAIFEAMARRRPVIAAVVDPLKRDYLCGEWFSRHITHGRSGEELAEGIARLIEDDALRKRTVDAAFEAVRGLSWPATADAYVRIWRRVLASTDRATAALTPWRRLAVAWQLDREARGGRIRLAVAGRGASSAAANCGGQMHLGTQAPGATVAVHGRAVKILGGKFR